MCTEVTKDYGKCAYVSKGQVWLVKESYKMTYAKIKDKSKIIMKTRPYLILTSENDIGILQAIPITSRDYSNENDIVFEGYDGTLERLKIDQIISIEKKNLLKYLYAIPDKLMDDVDSNIIKRFKLTGSVPCIEQNNLLNVNKETNIPIRKQYERWTDVMIRSYMEDYKILTKDQLSTKYNIDKHHLNQRYYKFYNKLNMTPPR